MAMYGPLLISFRTPLDVSATNPSRKRSETDTAVAPPVCGGQNEPIRFENLVRYTEVLLL
jgi:hypothetical protein